VELYGHTADTETPLRLSEVTLRGTPECLRSVACFLCDMADVIASGHDFESRQLSLPRGNVQVTVFHPATRPANA
jgi:hypothetical protein